MRRAVILDVVLSTVRARLIMPRKDGQQTPEPRQMSVPGIQGRNGATGPNTPSERAVACICGGTPNVAIAIFTASPVPAPRLPSPAPNRCGKQRWTLSCLAPFCPLIVGFMRVGARGTQATAIAVVEPSHSEYSHHPWSQGSCPVTDVWENLRGGGAQHGTAILSRPVLGHVIKMGTSACA